MGEFVKEYRADVDKEVSDSNKTFETNLKKKYDFVDKGKKVEPGDPKPDPNDISEVVKASSRFKKSCQAMSVTTLQSQGFNH